MFVLGLIRALLIYRGIRPLFQYDPYMHYAPSNITVRYDSASLRGLGNRANINPISTP